MRDRAAKAWRINATARGLRKTGHAVELHVDDTARPAGVVDADKIARQADRTAALAAKADRKAVAADAAVERLPEGGEPIKVGHHSEKRRRESPVLSWCG